MTDYIKRETALNLFSGEPLRIHYSDWYVDKIKALPAADVAPVVHARWITRSNKGIISMTHPYMCSRCWRVEMDKEPYCNCGAKMDGGADHADD